MRINIIGGGLAGCALAFVFKNAGHEPVIYEASDHLASGASGNDVGLYNPRFAAQMDAPSRYYSDAYFMALKVFEQFGDSIDWNPCGILSLMNTQRKGIRFRKTAASWGWAQDDMRVLSASESSRVSGVEIPCESLYLAKSGIISPKKLCHQYARGVEVHLNHPVEEEGILDKGINILACGIGSLRFEAASKLPLKSVRGQVTYVKQNDLMKTLKTVVSYSGYIAPEKGGAHCLGATFQPWLDHADIDNDDDRLNFENLFDTLPTLRGEYNVVGHRAGVRTASRDHFPVVGKLNENVFVSTAHGSHGILSTLLSANILLNMIDGGGYEGHVDVLNALSPHRFK
ncbi:MAG: FAD-dependent 5-carboxymethylaminomethyl-2-thiouridine(34) oxidoreductase MnmC [Alphaproteobacteria bacterium]